MVNWLWNLGYGIMGGKTSGISDIGGKKSGIWAPPPPPHYVTPCHIKPPWHRLPPDQETKVLSCHYVTPCTCASLAVPHHVTSSHPDIEYPQTRKPRFYHVTPYHYVTPCTCATPCHIKPPWHRIPPDQETKVLSCHQCHPMSHHAPVPDWQCHTMSHQATLTLNTPRLGNHGFIMSPMSLCHTMHLCHTMSHQATLTSNTPRPGNHGFIMSPMSLCHTMHLCHTMSHRLPPDQETKVLSCHPMHLCQPGSATPCHYVTPCSCATPCHIKPPWHRLPPDHETTVLSCHQCHTMHLCQPGSATSSHPDIDYPQTRKPRFYHVTTCTCASATPCHIKPPDIEYPPDQKTTVLSCHQCHTMHLWQPGSATTMSHQATPTSTTPRPGNTRWLDWKYIIVVPWNSERKISNQTHLFLNSIYYE